jgi:hypothetical protein
MDGADELRGEMMIVMEVQMKKNVLTMNYFSA